MNFESPGALRRRIDAAQYADESVDELSLGMARRAPSGVDSSMLSLADSSRDLSSLNKSISRSGFMLDRRPNSPPPQLPTSHLSPIPQPSAAQRTSRSSPVDASKSSASNITPVPQRRALTPTLAPTQDRQASSRGSSELEAEESRSEPVLKPAATAAPLARPTAAPTGPAKSTTATAFSVAARRIRIANGTPPAAPNNPVQLAQQSPSYEVSTPRATHANSATADLSSTPTGKAQAAHVSYAPSTVSTTSSNDLLTPAAHHLRRGNTSLPQIVGAESVVRPRGGAAHAGGGASRIASGNATGAQVDVGKLAAYQHKINERLEQENGRLRDDAEQLTSKVEELEDEMEQKEAELDRALAANAELKRQLDQRGQQEEQLEEEHGRYRDNAEQLSSKLERLEKALERKDAELARAVTAKENMQKRLVERDRVEERLKKENAEVWSDAELLTAKIEELEAELEEQRADLERANNTAKELEDELDGKESELDRLLEAHKSLQDEAKRKDGRLDRALAANEELKAQLEQCELELEEERAIPPRQERSQTVRFDESLGQDDRANGVGAAATSRSVLRAPSVRSPGNKTFELSLPNIANLSTMSWLNETTIGDQGMLAIIQQLQREVDERNLYVDDLMSKLDSYGKLLLQLGEKYELAQRKLAALTLVERDHDRMVVEREEIMHDVDRLESDMRAVRQEAASIGRELEALRSVKEARRGEESTVGLQVEIMAQLRKHHVEECKGLMLRIRYLKTKWLREANFRSDLGYQKAFLHQLVGGLERDLASTQIFVADVSRSRGLGPRERTPRNRLREAMLAVRAVVRMRLLSQRWSQASANKSALNDALIEARARREERRLNEGERPVGRASV